MSNISEQEKQQFQQMLMNDPELGFEYSMVLDKAVGDALNNGKSIQEAMAAGEKASIEFMRSKVPSKSSTLDSIIGKAQSMMGGAQDLFNSMRSPVNQGSFPQRNQVPLAIPPAPAQSPGGLMMMPDSQRQSFPFTDPAFEEVLREYDKANVRTKGAIQ